MTAVQPGGRLVNLSYDSLIAAEGAGQPYFGHDEYAEWAPGKTLADALDNHANGGRVEKDTLARQRGSAREPTALHQDG